MTMSALPPEADMTQHVRDVRVMPPLTDILRRSGERRHVVSARKSVALANVSCRA